MSSQPVKGDGNLTVNLTVDAGERASFKVQGPNGSISEVRTVADNGRGDQNSTSGFIRTTLDLGSMYSSPPESGQAVVYAAQNNSSFSIPQETYDTKRQFMVDSTPPNATVFGGTSELPRSPAYRQPGQQVQLYFGVTDRPQKIRNWTLKIVSPGGTVVKTFSGNQSGDSKNVQFVIPSDWSEGEYTLVLTAIDEVGQTDTDRYKGLVVDDTPPRVASVRTGNVSSGPSNATNKLLVQFSERALNNDSISSEDFTIPGYLVENVNVTSQGVILTVQKNTSSVDTLETSGPVLDRGAQPAFNLSKQVQIKDAAGNVQNTSKQVTSAVTDGLRPRAPNKTTVMAGSSVSTEAITNLSSVTVTAHFIRYNSSNETWEYVAPEGGTVHVKFTGPSGTTVTRTVSANTTSGTTTGTFDLTGAGFQDGEVLVQTKMVDDSSNAWQSRGGYTAGTTITVDTPDDTTPPVFAEETPAPGSTVTSVSEISVDIADRKNGVDESSIAVYIDDGDSDTTWDVKGIGTNDSAVTWSNGTLTVAPPSMELGEITVKVVAADGAGNRGNTTWSFTLQSSDDTPPTFTKPSPAPGSTVGAPLDAISVGLSDSSSSTGALGSGVNESTIAVYVDDGDANTKWDVAGVGTADRRVSYANGTLTFTPGSGFEAGPVTVKVVAADQQGNQANTTWSFTVQEIDQVTLRSIEHDFVGVVREPDGTVAVTATASANGTTVNSTSGGQFALTLLRNGSQVEGTRTVYADASGGTIEFDLTRAINGTPVAGNVTVQVSVVSADATDSGTVVLTHKVVSFGEKWDLLGTPMPVEQLHTSGVATFYGYEAGQGYVSSPPVTEPGVGYYAERADNATTARVGYTFRTTGRTTLKNTTLESGWNLLGPSFDIDATDSVQISDDLAPAQFSDPGVVVFAERNGDLVQVTDPNATITEFSGYFVYTDANRTRVVAVETYEPTQD